MFQIINIYSVNHFSLHLLTIMLPAFIKGFFVFLVAYITIPLLKNLSSEFKHLLWLFAILSFIIIPLSSVFIPSLNLKILLVLRKGV